MAEQFSNLATTTLVAAISDSDTTFDVADVSLFPSGPQFRILIDSEWMLVTNILDTTFTVTRGIEDSIAAAHDINTPVRQVLTAGALYQLETDTRTIQQFVLFEPDLIPTDGTEYYALRVPYDIDGVTAISFDFTRVEFGARIPASGSNAELQVYVNGAPIWAFPYQLPVGDTLAPPQTSFDTVGCDSGDIISWYAQAAHNSSLWNILLQMTKA